jgi:hypothetical protein
MIDGLSMRNDDGAVFPRPFVALFVQPHRATGASVDTIQEYYVTILSDSSRSCSTLTGDGASVTRHVAF